MGQKINPLAMRIGITENWRSRWYATKQDYGTLLVEDHKIRKYIKGKYDFAGISRIDIERTREEVRVILHSMRPGVIIGRKGAEIDNLRGFIEDITGRKVSVSIREVPRPELNAQLVAESIGEQLKKRTSFKRALKKAAEGTMEAGALGVRLRLAGRLGGSDMARCEQISLGSIPLSTLRAKIDYGFANIKTTYGSIGVKCWIHLGEVDENGISEVEARVAAQSAGRGARAPGRPRAGGPGGGRGGRGRGRDGGPKVTRTRTGKTVLESGRPQGRGGSGPRQQPKPEEKAPEKPDSSAPGSDESAKTQEQDS